MSRYRKIESHLKQLGELQSIITSMKTLAQMELRKLARFTESQNAMVEVLAQTATDFLTFFPRPQLRGGSVLWLVVGSERGFCGGFNEQLISRLSGEWPECDEHPQQILAVGHKLCRRLDELLPGCENMAGASTSEEIPSLLSRMVEAIRTQLLRQNATILRVLYHGDDGDDSEERSKVVCHQLLPPGDFRTAPARAFPPHLYLTPETFFRDFLQHYLFLRLTQLITVSLLVENRYRVQHLSGAVRRLDERLAVLQSKARSLRQEEITEEIEIILLGSGAF